MSKWKSEDEIVDQWTKEIKDIKLTDDMERMIRRTNHYFFNELLDFKLESYLHAKKKNQ